MAEHSRSIDAPENKVCDICGGKIKPDMCIPAALYCEQCLKYHCEDHQKEHRFPFLQDHSLVSVHVHDTSPKSSASPEEFSEELMLPLNADQIPEKYCELHLISECNSCTPEKRELFTHLYDLNQEATENTDRGDDKIDSKTSTGINTNVIRDEINEEREKENISVEMQKDQIIQEIKEIIIGLDDIAQKNIEKVETLCQHAVSEIDTESDRIKQTNALISGHIAGSERREASPEVFSEEFMLPMNPDQISEKCCELHLISECNSYKPKQRELCRYLHDLEQEATGNTDTGDDSIDSETSTGINSGVIREYLNEEREKEKLSVEMQKDQIIQEIKEIIKDLNDIGQKNIEEVETLGQHVVGKIDTRSDRIKQTRVLISGKIAGLERIEESPEEFSEEFMLPMNTDKISEKYCELHLISECNSGNPECRELCPYLHDLNQEATENADVEMDSIDLERSTCINMDVIREEMNDEMEKEKLSVEMQKDQILQKIKEIIRDLDDLGQKNTEEIERLTEHTVGEIDTDSERIKQTQAMISGNIAELERIEKIGSPEEVFLAVLHAEKEAAKYQDMLNESSTTILRKFRFEINNKLNNITDIGRITVEKLEPDIHICDYFVTESRGKVYWFDVLSDERLIVLHTEGGNSLLSIYSIDTASNKEPLSQLSVFGASSAVKINDHLVIVQRWEKLYLHMVIIDDKKLSDGDDINAEALPKLIQKFTEESLLLAIHKKRKRLRFQIIGLDGQIQRDIPTNTEIAVPRLMRINSDRSVVYVLDPINGCYGFDLDGDQIFQYAINDCDNYQGLAVDQNNKVYSAASINGGHVLTKLSSKGDVLKEKDTDQLYPFMCRGNRLYLTGCNDQKCWIFSYAYI